MTTCYFCKGKVTPKRIRHIHRWGKQVFILEDVPAEVCQQCGEIFFAPDILAEMDKIATSNTRPKTTVVVPVYSFA
jgi:YgiT-type zinc finger domain-containing protein